MRLASRASITAPRDFCDMTRPRAPRRARRGANASGCKRRAQTRPVTHLNPPRRPTWPPNPTRRPPPPPQPTPLRPPLADKGPVRLSTLASTSIHIRVTHYQYQYVFEHADLWNQPADRRLASPADTCSPYGSPGPAPVAAHSEHAHDAVPGRHICPVPTVYVGVTALFFLIPIAAASLSFCFTLLGEAVR